MNGRGHDGSGASVYDPGSKWPEVLSMLLSDKIGVLALQETHMTEKLLGEIETRYEKQIRVFSSMDEEKPNSKGVAIVLNKRLTKTEEVNWTEIVPGRALQISYPWHKNRVVTILAIYAPASSDGEKSEFWEMLRQTYTGEEKLPFPDFVLGDMNLVSAANDRLPPTCDNPGSVSAMDSLLSALQVVDGWRNFFPTEKAFTHTSASTKHKARLDRIYVGKEQFVACRNWEIKIPDAVTTDHWLVSVELTDPKMPYVGRGRYAMPRYVLEVDKVMKEIIRDGIGMQNVLKEFTDGRRARTEHDNPQTH
ncbi:DNase I-like protein [Schizophyllum commune Loenen D]|nr:DNase I-like protein [Schizophyllum commune Loenen D]